MFVITKPQCAQPETRERSDLQQQYRPIGIGAVAAAVSIRLRPPEGGSSAAAPADERVTDSMAA